MTRWRNEAAQRFEGIIEWQARKLAGGDDWLLEELRSEGWHIILTALEYEQDIYQPPTRSDVDKVKINNDFPEPNTDSWLKQHIRQQMHDYCKKQIWGLRTREKVRMEVAYNREAERRMFGVAEEDDEDDDFPS